MEFTLRGQRLDLTAEKVQDRLLGTSAEPVHQYGVLIGSQAYPVKQAFEAASGVARSEFTTQTARRHLTALGFTITRAGNRESATPVTAVPSPRSNPVASEMAAAAGGDWHTEARVQALVVTYLARAGWDILRVADTASRERGVDVVASRDGQTVAIEVKGFPGRGYADPRRKGERKRAQPSTQAVGWYGRAILAAMLTRSRMPEARPVIALPDFPRYRSLYQQTEPSLRDCSIELWWVSRDGTVTPAGGEKI